MSLIKKISLTLASVLVIGALSYGCYIQSEKLIKTISQSAPVVNIDNSGDTATGDLVLGSTFIRPIANTTSTNSNIQNLTFTHATGTDLYLSSKLKTDSIQSISGGISLLASGDIYPTINFENNGSIKLFEGAESQSSAELYIIGKTKFGETAYPDADNSYDFGSTANSWKNGYFDGTIYGHSLNLSSIAYVGTYKPYDFTSNLSFALRQNTANYVFQDASSSALMTLFGYGTLATRNHIPSANNTYSLGSPATSWANLYTSGTIYSVNQINTGTVTSTNMSIGSMVIPAGSGVVPIISANVGGTYGDSAGYSFDIGGNSALAIRCLSYDSSSCITSSTHISAYLPITYPVTATTTVTTSTALGLGAIGFKPMYKVIGSNVGTTTPNQYFTTSTAITAQIAMGEICSMGLSDTQTITIVDSAYIHTAGGASMVIGEGDIWCAMYSAELNYWLETRRSDN